MEGGNGVQLSRQNGIFDALLASSTGRYLDETALRNNLIMDQRRNYEDSLKDACWDGGGFWGPPVCGPNME